MRQRIVVLLALFLLPATLLAVDGVVLINQSTVMATGGFPYTITQPGSYKLSGNLTVPNINTGAIVIASDRVTLDLNGFALIGPAECPAPTCAAGAGAAHGITAGTDTPAKGYSNITIRNGTVRGMGRDGIHVLGDSVLIEYVQVNNNLLSGIVVRSPGPDISQTNLILRYNNIQHNGSYGIKAYAGLITDNSISESGDPGISVQVGGGVVSRNLVTNGASYGLSLTGLVGYTGNTLTNNNAGGVQVSGGVNLGQNLCGAVVCP
jgi:hypothetical protein